MNCPLKPDGLRKSRTAQLHRGTRDFLLGRRVQRINSFTGIRLLQRAPFSLHGVGMGVCCATNSQMFFSCLSLRQKNSLRALKRIVTAKKMPGHSIRNGAETGAQSNSYDELAQV